MANAFTRKALLVAEGTGGHFIPAIEVSLQLLKQGTAVTLWYAKRPKSQALSEALVEPAKQAGVNVEAVPVGAAQGLGRLRLARLLWNQAQQHFDSSAPDVVVGFGGWITMPVVLAARCRGIRCVLHEGNVTMGRANRWLAPWVNDIALSFQSPKHRCRSKKMVVTGFPIRSSIGELKEKPWDRVPSTV
ncbi:MAG: glycosyltransferase [Candidatus Omnitrophica bacterium]|nr:glycosyltransferase [Candidatus Omnitrophota bacterium]